MLKKEDRLTQEQIAALWTKYGVVSRPCVMAPRVPPGVEIPDGAVEFELFFRAPNRHELKAISAKAQEKGITPLVANEFAALMLVVVVTGASPADGDADQARAALRTLIERPGFGLVPNAVGEELNEISGGVLAAEGK